MYKALIIGAGSIGGLIDSPISKAVASHAHAYQKHSDTQLCAICEPSELNAFAFMERWGDVHRYVSVDEISTNDHYDIVSISSTTKSHFYDLMTLLKRQDASMILCEKPLVATQEELSTLYTLLLQSDKKILVHFIRRYNPTFIHLAERVQKGEFGKSLGFQGVCTKGLLHNGSHMLAVLSHFLGNLVSIKPFRGSFCHEDLCGEFGVSLENTDGLISVIAHPPYALFEITFWFERGMIKILDGGDKIEIYSRVPSTYEGYFSLALHETITTNLSNYAYDSVEFLLKKNKETCKQILSEHLHIHTIIFQTFSKVLP